MCRLGSGCSLSTQHENMMTDGSALGWRGRAVMTCFLHLTTLPTLFESGGRTSTLVIIPVGSAIQVDGSTSFTVNIYYCTLVHLFDRKFILLSYLLWCICARSH
eukprot:m.151386 g.151386  ORF g.151386 m.151386 type:complete len:104 (+) comp13292_c0_seq1:2170-2481(+)